MEQTPVPNEHRHFTGAQKLAILREHLVEIPTNSSGGLCRWSMQGQPSKRKGLTKA